MAGAFNWDGPTPMGLAAYVQQQGDFGRQRGEDSRLARLVSGAMADPSKRQANVAEIASFRPEAAFQAQGQFDQQEDVRNKRLGEMATIYVGAPASQKAAILQQFAPELSRFGMQIGPDFAPSPEIDQMAAQLAQVYGDKGNQAPVTPSLRAVEAAYARGDITKDEYQKGVKIALDLAPGASAPTISYQDQWDPVRQVMTRVPVQTRGLDYTGGAPSLTYGSQPQPEPSAQPQPQPANQTYAGNSGDLPKTPLLDTFSQQFPGFRATSTYRDPKHNADVGGISNSYHTRDGGAAIDGYPSSPQELAQIEQWAAQNGHEVLKYPGGRIHVEPAPGMSPASNFPPPADPNANSPYLRTNINNVGGGAIVSGPSNAEKVEQQRREAEASAQGRISGERSMGANFGDETTLRKEYETRIAEPRSVVDAYRRVEGATQNDSAAGDLSLIFAYMKMLDPGSVVREGEFANAQNAAGVPDQVWNLYNRAITGERLNPNQRRDFLAQAVKLRDQAQARIDEANKRYRELAPSYNMDPNRIAPAPAANASGIDDLVSRWAD